MGGGGVNNVNIIESTTNEKFDIEQVRDLAHSCPHVV